MSTPSPGTPVLPPALENAPSVSVDLAKPLSAEEAAQIAATQKKPEQVRWGPLSKMALLALGYVRKTEQDANERIHAIVLRERAEASDRWDEFVAAWVGRSNPLEGHKVETQELDGKTYLVAVPLEGQS